MDGQQCGVPVIVTAPSGGGKTTLIRRVREQLESEGRNTHFAVSHTTRLPRGSEVTGRDYHFVTRQEFQSMVDAGDFLEYAQVHGELYGTSRREVEGRLGEGWYVFLDIDVQGARQVRRRLAESLLVFVFPPSYRELRHRLVERGQDAPEQIDIRMRNAMSEMNEFSWFDCVIINDRLDEAVREFYAAVVSAHLRFSKRREHAEAIIRDFRRCLEE